MTAREGLASMVCETKTAKALAGVAVVMNALAVYFFFTEVSRSSFAR